MKVILLTDVNDVWIKSDDNKYIEITNDFFIKHNISIKLVEKADREIFLKLKKQVRKGKISYKKLMELYFKSIDAKNYRKLVREYFQFEKKIVRKWLKLVPYAKEVLMELKRSGIKIIAISDYIKPSKERKWELDTLGIGKYFDKIYTSHDLRKEKPEALKLFRPKRKELMIFLGHEDDEMVCKKYGLITIGLKNLNADYTIKSLKELPGIIKKLMKET